MPDLVPSPHAPPDAALARPQLEALLGRPGRQGGDGHWLPPRSWDRRHAASPAEPPRDWAHIRVWRPGKRTCVVLASGLVTPGASRPTWGETLYGAAPEWVRLVTELLRLERRVHLHWNVVRPEADVTTPLDGPSSNREQILTLSFDLRRPRSITSLARTREVGWEITPTMWTRIRLEELERVVGGGVVRYAPGLHRPELIDRAMNEPLPLLVEVDPFAIRARLGDAATLRRLATSAEVEGEPAAASTAAVLRMAAAMLVQPLERIRRDAAEICVGDLLCDVRRTPVALDAKDRHQIRAAARLVPRDDIAGALARIRATLESGAHRPAVRAALVRAHDTWARSSDVSPIGSPEEPDAGPAT